MALTSVSTPGMHHQWLVSLRLLADYQGWLSMTFHSSFCGAYSWSLPCSSHAWKWFPRLVAPPLCQKSRWGWPACKFPRFLPFMSKGGAFTVLQFSGNFLTCNSLANIVRLRSATPKSLYTWECSVCLHTLSCSLSTKQVSLRSRFSHWSWAWDPEGRSYQ